MMVQGLKIGTILQNGTYRIVKVLGQGSFGITYLVSTELINCHGSKAVDSILCNGICP